MATKRELMEAVRYKLAGQQVDQWDIRKAVEKAYTRISRLTDCFSTGLITCQAVANQAAYPLSDFSAGVGSRIYKVTEVWYNESMLEYISIEELKQKYTGWRYVTPSVPFGWTMQDSTTLLLYPPTSGIEAIAISGYCTPDLEDFGDDDEPAFHEDFHELIEYFACASLATGTTDEKLGVWRANENGQRFLSGLEDMRRTIGRMQGEPHRIGTGRGERDDSFGFGWMPYPVNVTCSSSGGDEMDALKVIDADAATLVEANTPQTLVATSTPCVLVWVGAYITADGLPTNSKPIFVGDADGQVLPIMPSDYKGVYLRLNDASLLYIKGSGVGDKLNFVIWSL